MKKSSKDALIFVVQKHAASHLHYDLRLEIDGVLKSWAVPKGPSMDPEDKRLAMMVEDHPYNYKDFEGEIPEGNYGAGHVIVWDNGTYEAVDAQGKNDSEKKLIAGLKKGHLGIVLHGEKLHGEFNLIHLHGKQENAWLLIKKEDGHELQEDILLQDRSVISQKTLEQLSEKNSKKEKEENKKSAEKKTTPSPKKIEHWIPTIGETEPMLAKVTEKVFDDPGWIFEIKYDGYRTLAVINGERQVELFSRNHISFNKYFKPIADSLRELEHMAILDGEVVVEDSNGRSDFQLLQNYRKTGEGILKYYVFDILNLDGKDTRSLPLLQRKELLKILLENQPMENIHYSEHISENGVDFYALAQKNNLEGIMAKEANSPYRSGRRSEDWLKIKINRHEEAIIIGITAPGGSRHRFGSLLLGRYEEGELKFIGGCGSGFTDAILEELYKQFEPYFNDNPSVTEKLKLREKIQWIKPKFVCQVKFTEWTRDQHLRHPVFQGLRIDKSARDVTAPEVVLPETEEATGVNPNTEKNYDRKIGKVTLHFSNQHKEYFPEDHITKGDLVNYYDSISEIILPYLKDRPQSMNRFPSGIHGTSFYQKDVDLEKSPEWLKTFKVFSDSNNEHIDYLICNDKATLLYMANLGCIEINPWNSTTKNLEKPSWIVIDLDPDEIHFREVIRAAHVTKQIFDELDTECYCKTSGATGLHIYVPLDAKYDYDTVKTFAQLIAHTVNVRLPNTTSIERATKKRPNRIYIDFLQNRRGQTLAAPYSVRPRPGATVSTPLEWHEVNEKLSPRDFTIKNILKRIDKKGDLWKPVLGKGADLENIINKIQNDK